ncbi:MAG: AIR synthase-related protein, partial [Halodesulfurarchaeum sp.]
LESTRSVHDVSDGGLAVTLAEMVRAEAGVDVSVPSAAALFSETPGRVVVETTDREALETVVGDAMPVQDLGVATADGTLTVTADGQTITEGAAAIAERRSTLETLG